MNDQLILSFERIEGVKTEFAVLSLDEVSSEEEMSERGLISKPTASFVDSIRQFGQVDPILALEKTTDTGEKWYQVWSGSRRIRAIRQLAAYGEHDPSVKAQIIKEDWNVPYDALLMILNAARDGNEIADYFAIKRIMEEDPGKTLADISKELNGTLTVGEIKKRLAFSRIPESLLNGVTAGMLTLQTARTITKLPKKIQIDMSEKVQTSLDLIKETENTKFDDPAKKQEVIRDIIRDVHIAGKSLKQAKIDNANHFATLKLSNILDNNADKSTAKISENKTEFYVLHLTGAEHFKKRKTAEQYQQEMTAQAGIQYVIVESEVF